MNELPTSAMGVMRLLPSTAAQVGKFAHQLIKSVREGNVNALEMQVILRAVEAMAKEVREEIDQNVVTESEKYAEKKFNAFGAIVEKAELGVEYQYETSKDTIYERLQTDFNTAKSRLDERTAFLRGLKQPMTIVDEMTGEVVTINPPLKKSKPGVKVYLANVK